MKGPVVVVTVVRGRHEHLRRQHEALARGTRLPAHVVVVAMGDPGIEAVVNSGPLAGRSRVVHLPSGRMLPLARARNTGGDLAFRDLGAGLAVFLDVDCLPDPPMLASYVDAFDRTAYAGARLLNGVVCYLPPPGPRGYTQDDLASASPHIARPAPEATELVRSDAYHLFWSLSFALDRDAWSRIGGFDERYTGYGGEDTDLGQRAAASSVALWWVGGARAYHQWHPVSDPPVEHLDDIVRNANLFHERWGWFPMQGWLEAFADRRLAHRDPRTGAWRVVAR